MSDLFTQVGADVCQPETTLSTYNFNGSAVRITKDENGEPWFVGKDVCEILGYVNASKALYDHVDDEDKLNNESLSTLGQRGGWLINESGVYSLVLRSNMPEAKAFKRWVTHEVLPAIRRDGGYIAAAPEETPEQLYQRCMSVLHATIERQKKQLEEARATIAQKGEQLELAAPKVAFVETFATSTKGNILVRDFAGMLARSLGMRGFGQNALFDWLKKHGFMNLNRYPSQYAKNLMLLESTEGFHVHHDGTTGVHHCTRITPKGQTYFFEKIKKQFEEEGRWW